MTKKNKSAIQRRLIPTYIFLIIVSFISVFPLYWMISAATNTSTDVSRGRIIPGSHFMENFRNLTSQQPLWRALGNSFFYAILTTVICLLICSIAGYGFEVYHDKWKDRVFSILLLAMMVPQVATMVPLFKMFSKAGLLNTAVGFILPICCLCLGLYFFFFSKIRSLTFPFCIFAFSFLTFYMIVSLSNPFI